MSGAGAKFTNRTVIKFRTVVDVRDLITHANSGELKVQIIVTETVRHLMAASWLHGVGPTPKFNRFFAQ